MPQTKRNAAKKRARAYTQTHSKTVYVYTNEWALALEIKTKLSFQHAKLNWKDDQTTHNDKTKTKKKTNGKTVLLRQWTRSAILHQSKHKTSQKPTNKLKWMNDFEWFSLTENGSGSVGTHSNVRRENTICDAFNLSTNYVLTRCPYDRLYAYSLHCHRPVSLISVCLSLYHHYQIWSRLNMLASNCVCPLFIVYIFHSRTIIISSPLGFGVWLISTTTTKLK